ncbi:MAG TPA: SDR family oxidoreductase [Mycobacteriales bacterium]|nr:SDR family oxidoreductase [Mycobacteriales bacterium]
MGIDLDGAKVLVTGASTGIGAALAIELGKAGATIAITARRQALLDEVLAEAKAAGAGPDSYAVAADLGDIPLAEKVALEAWERLGHVDAVVNNAAIPKRRHVIDLPGDELDLVMRVNFTSPARICLALLPKMLERKAGMLVNVGSMAGRLGNPGEIAYCASKFALSGFTETLAIDLAGTGVEARLVTPGPFDTPIWDMEGEEPAPYEGPKYPPSVAAEAIVAALRGDGGFEHIVPPEMKGVVEFKAQDIDTYLQGAIAFSTMKPHDH